MPTWRVRAAAPVDGTSLAVLRIAIGAVGLLSAARLIARGWVDTLLVQPDQHLRYPGLGWVPVPPGWLLWVLVLLVAAASVAVLLGWRTRAAFVVLAVCFTWLELVEVTIYLNHYWFLTLVLVLGAVLPMGNAWSLDARRHGDRPAHAGAVWLLRAQVGVVYTFAGIAKLHGDWLVHGLPLGLWLPARAELPLVGGLLAAPETALALSWAGALFDCTVVALLCWRRSRPFAFAAVVVFHGVTWWLFPSIGVFPLLMVAMATVFFEPDWPRRLRARMARPPVTPSPAPAGEAADTRATAALTRPMLVFAAVWLAVQVVLPLRHLVYPGDHRWSGEGFRFGWNVMLVEKSGDVVFRVHDPATGTTWRDDARSLLTDQQWTVMATDPELVRQSAHLLATQERRRGLDVEVRADVFVSLNGRSATRLVDPDVDLAAEPWGIGPQPWILPAPTGEPPG